MAQEEQRPLQAQIIKLTDDMEMLRESKESRVDEVRIQVCQFIHVFGIKSLNLIYCLDVTLLLANLVNTKWYKYLENDWNPGTWVLNVEKNNWYTCICSIWLVNCIGCLFQWQNSYP